MKRNCPFCGEVAEGDSCQSCGLPVTASRRVCTKCGKITLSQDSKCVHCGMVKPNELAWKIPLIIILFIIAFVITVLIQLA